MDWLKHAQGTRQAIQPDFRPGDQLRVWYHIQERDRVRLAQFEGIVIRLRGSSPSKTITVRRVTFGEGVERVFFLDGPSIERIEVVRRGKVRRNRLYFLRAVIGKTRIAAKEDAAGKPTSTETEPPKPADATAVAGTSSGSEPPTS